MSNTSGEIKEGAVTANGLLRLCDDGAVICNEQFLHELRFNHLISGLDQGPGAPKYSGAVLAYISGYTEWLSDTRPVITLGWDWYIDVSVNPPQYRQCGYSRSNLILVNGSLEDITDNKKRESLCRVISSLKWVQEVIDSCCLEP